MRLAEPGRCRKAGPGADNTWFTDDDLQSSYGANSIIYCGYRYDAETDNYYVRNRYYSPTLGRWLSRDPIGYEGGINLYGYVDSSPVGNVDAGGTWAWYDPFSWPIWHEIWHSTPAKAVGNAAPYGVPGTDLAGPIAGGAEALLPLANWGAMAQQRWKYDECQGINRHTDPYYEGAKALANHQPLTPAEHAAILKAIKSPWWLP